MQLQPRAFEGEILPPSATVHVIGRTHPLAGDRVVRDVAAGLSIAEILHACAGSKYTGGFIVHIDGHAIRPELFARVRVKAGATLTFLPRLQNGGGGTVWKSVLGIVIAVGALAIAGPAGGWLAATALGTAIGLSASVAGSLVAAGVMLAGTLALNALFPTRPAQVDSASSTALNSIQGAQNQADPFGPVPVVLGRHRQSPRLAAKPYTEIVGDDQYLRLLFCLGYGPLLIEDMQIGETPLASYSDIEIQTRQGFVGDAPITLYPGSVDEQALSVELDAPIDEVFADPNPGDWHSQTTAAETDQISLDFTAVDGIYATDPQGDERQFTVRIEVQYRVAASGSGWTAGGQVIFTRSIDPARRGLVISVTRGQYEVQARRTTGRGRASATRDEIVWTALRSIKNVAPISFGKPLALVALRIKATGQLSGTVDTFNCITTSLVTAYSGSGSTWTADTASAWPADLFRSVLQSPANARPRTDAQIDLTGLQAWWAYCVSKGFKFNQVLTSVGSVYDKLADIAAAGRAVVTFVNGKWGVAWDRPDDPIVQHFTPRNSWGFQLQKTYAQQPHGWRVTFINEDNGFTQDERVVYDDGFDVTNATLFEGIEFPGVTDPDLIWMHGRFHIAQSRLRPEKVSLNVGWENLVCSRGDRVKVTHDVLLIGLASGRLKAIAGQVVTLDELVTVEDGKTYGITFRVPEDARSLTFAVDASTVPGDYTELTLVGDLSALTVGNIFAFGETDRESAVYRVQGISHQKGLIATLTLVDDAPEISEADAGAIPPYTPNVTIPADPFTLPPRDLRYYENIDGQGATARALVHLFWQVPRFGNIASFEAQMQDVDNGGPWEAAGSVVPPVTAIDVPISRAGVFSFRVRCVFSNGTVSAWSTLANLTLQALSSPPADITNLHQRSVDGQTALDWTTVDDKRLINYEIRKGTTWDTGLVVGDVIAQPPWATTGDGTYHVRAYVLAPFGTRIYSVNDASIAIEGSIISRNIIVSKNEQADGWNAGVGLDGGVIDGDFIRTDPASSITQAFAEAIISDLNLSGTHIAVFVAGQIVDIGRAAECRFWTEFEAVGVLQGADFLGVSTGLTDWLAQTDVLGASPTRVIRAFPVWRFAGDSSVDAFSEPDVFAPSDVFTAGLTWGAWVAIATGTRVARYFQAGFILITDQETVNATGTKFSWFVDVPDRTDDYTNVSVPNTGLSIDFYAGGYDATPLPGRTAVPFNGGPNGSTVPHVQRAIVNETPGDEVKITALTAAGCTITVLNGGSAVARDGVNLLVRGY